MNKRSRTQAGFGKFKIDIRTSYTSATKPTVRSIQPNFFVCRREQYFIFSTELSLLVPLDIFELNQDILIPFTIPLQKFYVFQIWPVFGPGFRFLHLKTEFFRFWWVLRFTGFLHFSLWFSVFVKNDRGFSYFSAHCILHLAFSLRPSSDVVLLRCPN